MSSFEAIKGVTATLCYLLDQGSQVPVDPPPIDHVPGTNITTLPPDKAQEGNGKRLNLFLYQITPNAAWRNMPLPNQVKSGEFGYPPLAVDLHYLLTAYDSTDQEADLETQRLLGRAMLILHDNGLIDRTFLEQISPDSGLHQQVEQIKVIPSPLSLEEMSKLWTTFQSQYRLSVAYQVSVLLIESTKETRMPLPVLRRGAEDQGVLSQANMLPPVPTLTDIKLPAKQPSLRLNQVLTLNGHKLRSGPSNPARVVFYHPHLADRLEIEANRPENTDRLIQVSPNDLPEAAQAFAPGFYQVVVEVEESQNGQVTPRATNALTFPLAPGLENLEVSPNPADPNKLQLTVTSVPPARQGQRVSALLGSIELPAQSISTATGQITFDVTNRKKIPAGSYRVRLRVDGVDSHLIADYTALPLTFDDSLTITIADE